MYISVVSSLRLGKLSCPAGWYPNGSSCYKASEGPETWADAKQDCHASGGYLMKIDDEFEQHFIEIYLRITGLVKQDDVSTYNICIQ